MANVFDITRLGGFRDAIDKARRQAGDFITDKVAGHVLPPLPFGFIEKAPHPIGPAAPFEETAVIESDGENYGAVSIFGTPMCFPLWIKPTRWPKSKEWLLPVEPIITLSGGNIITRRTVAKANDKMRGTIKERWAKDDYAISINGLLTKWDDWSYPKDDVKKLREMLEVRDSLDVRSPLFELLGISRIVVERWDFPFTKGPENQYYSINAYSDDEWDLLIPIP